MPADDGPYGRGGKGAADPDAIPPWMAGLLSAQNAQFATLNTKLDNHMAALPEWQGKIETKIEDNAKVLTALFESKMAVLDNRLGLLEGSCVSSARGTGSGDSTFSGMGASSSVGSRSVPAAGPAAQNLASIATWLPASNCVVVCVFCCPSAAVATPLAAM